VILYSHGLGAGPNSAASYLRDWASKGFIVFSIAHENIIYMENVVDLLALR